MKVALDWHREAKLTCKGKTLWGTLKSLRRKGLRSWHSSKCVPSQLLYTDAFWSERKPSSLLNHSTPRDRMWGSNLPSVCCSLPWDSESGSVPASLSPTKRQASGQPQGERCETLAQPSCLWARLTACTGRGGSSFFWPQASVLGEPGIKKKDSILLVNGTYRELVSSGTPLQSFVHWAQSYLL